MRPSLWEQHVEPPEYSVGDEVCFYKSSPKDTCIITHVRTTTNMDDETYQEIRVHYNPYWFPAWQFAPVRRWS